MTRSRRLFAWAFVTTVLLARPSAAAEERPFATGNQAFRFTLGTLCGLRPLTGVKQLMDDPEHSLLVVTGDTKALVGSLWLLEFLNNNGSLLLATDWETPRENVNLVVGVGVAGGRVKALDPDVRYKGNEDCPIVVFRQHPVFEGIRSLPVATNRPSYVNRESLPPASPARRFRFDELASFPAGCRVDGLPGRRIFAVAHSGEGQRLLVLADHSVFINGMMLQDDNANLQFAYNCLRWLSENGRRSRVLYLDDGVVVDDFKVGLDEIPLPLPPLSANLPAPPAEVINHIVAAWEDDNIHNLLLLERFSRNDILRAVAVALTVALLGYGAIRLWFARHSTEPGR